MPCFCFLLPIPALDAFLEELRLLFRRCRSTLLELLDRSCTKQQARRGLIAECCRHCDVVGDFGVRRNDD